MYIISWTNVLLLLLLLWGFLAIICCVEKREFKTLMVAHVFLIPLDPSSDRGHLYIIYTQSIIVPSLFSVIQFLFLLDARNFGKRSHTQGRNASKQIHCVLGSSVFLIDLSPLFMYSSLIIVWCTSLIFLFFVQDVESKAVVFLLCQPFARHVHQQRTEPASTFFTGRFASTAAQLGRLPRRLHRQSAEAQSSQMRLWRLRESVHEELAPESSQANAHG